MDKIPPSVLTAIACYSLERLLQSFHCCHSILKRNIPQIFVITMSGIRTRCVLSGTYRKTVIKSKYYQRKCTDVVIFTFKIKAQLIDKCKLIPIVYWRFKMKRPVIPDSFHVRVIVHDPIVSPKKFQDILMRNFKLKAD